MTGTVGVLLVAVLAGVAVAVQGQAMGVMNRQVGTASSVLVTYGSGAIIAALVWLFARPAGVSARHISPLGWSAGLLGLVIVGGIGYAAPRIGLSRALIITVAAQLAAAIVIEHLGILGAAHKSGDAPRLIGVALTVAGAWLALR